MAAVALAGNALALARVAATMDAGIEILMTATKASRAIAQAQQEGREITPLEMDGLFGSDDAALASLHANIAAKMAAPGGGTPPATAPAPAA